MLLSAEVMWTLPDPGTSSQAHAEFGANVASDGNLTVVGSPDQDFQGIFEAGAAYVFDSVTGALVATLNNPTPGSEDWFGCSVAISGITVVVGARCDAGDTGSAYIFDATTGNLLRTLSNPTPAHGDYFGGAVGIWGGTVVVGAIGDSTAGIQGGSAYVFDATTGNLVCTLGNPTPASLDMMGDSVAIWGGTVVVGAPYDGTAGTNAGAAYVFDAASGDLLGTLTEPGPAGYGFGNSIAIWGGTIVAGSTKGGTGTGDFVAAYVFSAATGELSQTLSTPKPGQGTMYGLSVAVSGSTVVVVGAQYPANNDNPTGASSWTYIFDRGTGALLHSLDARGFAASEYFGASVSVSGGTVVVGAPEPAQTKGDGEASGATAGGAVFLLDLASGALLHTWHSPAPASNEYFGSSLGISGSRMVVGAPGDAADGPGSGAAYLYDTQTGALAFRLGNPDPGEMGGFGCSVAISGSTVVVGAKDDATGGAACGRAFVFDAATGSLLWTLNNPTPAAFDRFGFSVAASGGWVVVGARGDGSAGSHAGAVYVFNAATGSLLRTLTSPKPTANGSFGWSLGISGGALTVGAPYDNTGIAGSGSAYLFDLATGRLTRTLKDPAPAAGDCFGGSLAAWGSTVVVGAPCNGTGAVDSGAAYVYDLATGNLVHTLNNPAPAADQYFGTSIACSGGRVLVGASGDNVFGKVSGAAYVFDASTGTLLLTIANPTLARDEGFGTSVALADSAMVVASPLFDGASMYRGAAYVFRPIKAPHVVGRYVFYNASYWDGDDPAANAADDAAIAPDKQPLLPGGTAAFANYTSYYRGVNGIMIDVSDLPAGTPTAADFEFRIGNSNTPASWAVASLAPAISVRRGAGVGGSDRVTLIFPDGTAAGQWLGVTVLAGGSVGLAASDVFYFGNAIGEVGDQTGDAKVTVLDISAVRANQTTYVNPPALNNPYDFNRDRSVNTLDISLARSSQTTYATMLSLIAPPAAGAAPAAMVPPAAGEEAGTWAARLAAQVADSPATGQLGGVGVDLLAMWT